MTDQNYTELAVSLGRVEEGLKHVMAGIDDIKATVADQNARLGVVETKTASTEKDVTRIRAELDQATARKPPWTAIAAFVVAAIAAAKSFFGF